MNQLRTQYIKVVAPSLKEKLGYKNNLAVPTVKKVVINVGLGAGLKDKEFIDSVKNTLNRIGGQKPVETLSKKSISNFKIRKGMTIGVKVTLRGERMWDFLEKLIKITLPRVRDFRGVSARGFDANGNYSLGFKEFIAFPEIKPDELERMHGLEINITTTAKNAKEGQALMSGLGFPFKEEEK